MGTHPIQVKPPEHVSWSAAPNIVLSPSGCLEGIIRMEMPKPGFWHFSVVSEWAVTNGHSFCQFNVISRDPLTGHLLDQRQCNTTYFTPTREGFDFSGSVTTHAEILIQVDLGDLNVERVTINAYYMGDSFVVSPLPDYLNLKVPPRPITIISILEDCCTWKRVL